MVCRAHALVDWLAGAVRRYVQPPPRRRTYRGTPLRASQRTCVLTPVLAASPGKRRRRRVHLHRQQGHCRGRGGLHLVRPQGQHCSLAYVRLHAAQQPRLVRASQHRPQRQYVERLPVSRVHLAHLSPTADTVTNSWFKAMMSTRSDFFLPYVRPPQSTNHNRVCATLTPFRRLLAVPARHASPPLATA